MKKNTKIKQSIFCRTDFQSVATDKNVCPTFMSIKEILISINIILISTAIGFMFNSFNPVGLEFKKTSSSSGKILIYKDGKRINNEFGIIKHDCTDELEYLDLKMAKGYFDNKRAVFIDARTTDSFAYGHIKGAVSIPVAEFRGAYEINKLKLSGSQAIIIYCSSSLCPLSEKTAILLKLKGHKNIKISSGGWGEWTEAGYPTEKGVK